MTARVACLERGRVRGDSGGGHEPVTKVWLRCHKAAASDARLAVNVAGQLARIVDVPVGAHRSPATERGRTADGSFGGATGGRNQRDQFGLGGQCPSGRRRRSAWRRHPRVVALPAGRPARKAYYRVAFPKAERKDWDFMRRRHGGRRTCVRGLVKVAADFRLRAAAVNPSRLADLRVTHRAGGCAIAG